MIIDGFGGNGIVPGKATLLQTINCTAQATYNSGYTVGKMASEDILSTNVGGPAGEYEGITISFNANIPSPATYYNLGYSAIQYSSSLETSSITSGNVGIRANSNGSDQVIAANVKYGTAVAFRLDVLGATHYLIGTGSTVYKAAEISSAYSQYCAHLTPFNSLSWTKCQWTTYRYSSITVITQNTGTQTDASDTFVYQGVNRQGDCYWSQLGSTSIVNTWVPTLRLYVYSGCPPTDSSVFTQRIHTDRGGMYFHNTVPGHNSSGTAVTLTPTNPPPISFKVYVYGIG